MDLSRRKVSGSETFRKADSSFFFSGTPFTFRKPSNVPSAVLVETSGRPVLNAFSEQSFRDAWAYLSTTNLPLDEKKFLLKGNLDGWMRSAVAIKRKDFDQNRPIELDEGDLGVLSELRTVVDTALEKEWIVDYVVRVLQVTAYEKGIEL